MDEKLIPCKNRILSGGTLWGRSAAGFTLIELVTVVAVIAILAVIAIPQFQGYRRRGFDAASLSDIKNLFSSELGVFISARSYGWTSSTSPPDCSSKNSYARYVTGGEDTGRLVACSSPTSPPELDFISLSNGVTVAADIDTSTGPSSSYVAIAKHVQGDVCFAIDGDAPLIYHDSDQTKCGPGINIGAAPAMGLDDFAGQRSGRNDIQGKPGWEPQ